MRGISELHVNRRYIENLYERTQSEIDERTDVSILRKLNNKISLKEDELSLAMESFEMFQEIPDYLIPDNSERLRIINSYEKQIIELKREILDLEKEKDNIEKLQQQRSKPKHVEEYSLQRFNENRRAIFERIDGPKRSSRRNTEYISELGYVPFMEVSEIENDEFSFSNYSDVDSDNNNNNNDDDDDLTPDEYLSILRKLNEIRSNSENQISMNESFEQNLNQHTSNQKKESENDTNLLTEEERRNQMLEMLLKGVSEEKRKKEETKKLDDVLVDDLNNFYGTIDFDENHINRSR